MIRGHGCFYFSYTSARIFRIVQITGNHMNMDMKHRLASHGAIIDTEIISGGLIQFVNSLYCSLHYAVQLEEFTLVNITKRSYVTAWDQQSMPNIDRESVFDRYP